MQFTKILWPTDFSAAAEVAESYVQALTQQFNAEVHLVHVAEDLTQYESYWGSGPDWKHAESLNEYAMKVSKERLERLCKEKLTSCPHYQIHIVLGDPAKEILKKIGEIQPNLVIMATHGMKGNFPFGSVAERVVKNSPVPVLTINPTQRKAV